MKITLKNQVAWITGGSSGIGRAIAIEAARCGAKVAITARGEQELDEVAREIAGAGGTAITAPADVSESAEVEAAVKRIVDHWGRLDFVCANAGTNGTRISRLFKRLSNFPKEIYR